MGDYKIMYTTATSEETRQLEDAVAKLLSKYALSAYGNVYVSIKEEGSRMVVIDGAINDITSKTIPPAGSVLKTNFKTIDLLIDDIKYQIKNKN